jgi:hypothetical protein
MRNVYKFLIEKPKRKRKFGERRHKYEDNIKMDIEMCFAGVDEIQLTRDSVQCGGFCEHSNDSSSSIKEWLFVEKLLNKDSAPYS